MAIVSGGTPYASATFTQQGAAGTIFAGGPVPIPPIRMQCLLANGTGSDEMDGLYPNVIAFAASTPQPVDLATLLDIQGKPITAARIRFVLLKNLSQVDNDYFLVGNAGTNEFDGLCSAGATIKVYPSSALNDGFVAWSAPGVTAIPVGGSAYNLKIDPGTLAKSMAILIATCSA
jgi:hypothetical protein